MFEFKNLRTGRATYYYEQIAHRLPVKSSFVRKFTKPTSLVLKTSRKIPYEVFW
jgi:hypothetical protein